MTIQTTLPRVNELGYYEMRLESIGGLGAVAEKYGRKDA